MHPERKVPFLQDSESEHSSTTQAEMLVSPTVCIKHPTSLRTSLELSRTTRTTSPAQSAFSVPKVCLISIEDLLDQDRHSLENSEIAVRTRATTREPISEKPVRTVTTNCNLKLNEKRLFTCSSICCIPGNCFCCNESLYDVTSFML